MTDDEDQAPREHIALGGDTEGDRLDALLAWGKTLRRGLGRWFVPVAVVAIAATLIIVVIAVTALRNPADESTTAEKPSSPSTTARSAGPETTDPPTGSDPLTGLAFGDPPVVPYYADRALHWQQGKASLPPGSLRSVVSRAGVSLVDLFSGQLLRVAGPRLRPLAYPVESQPVIGPEGRLAAWTESRGPDGQLVLWNLATMREQSRQPIDLGFTCCDHPGVQIVGIDGAGRVYLTADSHYLVWNPAQRSIDEMAGTRAYVRMVTVTPQGPVFLDSNGAGRAARSTFGQIDETGHFMPLGQIHSAEGAWSPGGDVVAHKVSDDQAVAHPINGLATLLHTPPGMEIGDIRWESDVSLLIVVTDDDGRATWIRCMAGTGECEIPVDLGPSSDGSITWRADKNNPLRFM
jgi:hypothetical protein